MIHLISVFEIPHILDSICGYLALRHLAVCVRVSKPWSSHFLPALYRSLYFSTKVELRHITPKNFKLIQTITTATLSEPLWDDYETYSLPNIKELQLHWCLINYVDTERCIPKAMSFLAIHPSLRYLDLSVQGISQETLESVVKAITEHPGLRSLRLTLSLEITQLHLNCLFSCLSAS